MPEHSRLVAIVVLVFALTSCGNRIEVVLTDPLTTPMMVEDLRREISRARWSSRRRLHFQTIEEAEHPITIDGRPLFPVMPRTKAVEEAVRVLSVDYQPVIVAIPPQAVYRQSEASAAAELGAIVVMVNNPGNFSGTAEEIRSAGATGGAGVVLLLGESTPQAANWLLDIEPGLGIVVEALFASSVDRLRESGVEVFGSIAFDLAGTLDTTDNYTDGEGAPLALRAVFFP